VTIDLKINAYINDEYISSEIQKIEMYKRIASVQDEEDVVDIRDELLDRYGDIPNSVENLIQIAYIKALAGDLNFVSISEKGDSIIFQIKDEKSISPDSIGRLAAKYKRQILFNAGANPYILYKITANNREKLLENIKIILHDIKSFVVK
jgi:transcription-repair coupling factor (superfamily II helicase)